MYRFLTTGLGSWPFCYISLVTYYSYRLLRLSQHFFLSTHFNFSLPFLHPPNPLPLFQPQSSDGSRKQPGPPWSSQHHSFWTSGATSCPKSLSFPLHVLVPHFALFPQSFEPQPTWWCGKEDDDCMFWGWALEMPKAEIPSQASVQP